MAATLDYSRLREETLGSGQDEAVTVNTRALIDKVLARYSGEWTTLRELIQNAADASASKVTIKFETMPSVTVPAAEGNDASSQIQHTIRHHTVKRLVVSNNGQPFAETDWSRLKRIAEGNPDETKIGAFGVGFYSVFSECENPFVISGTETMAFHWKGNSLYTRRGKLPAGHSDTCFMLDYRNQSSPVPNLLSICQFLSTSSTFLGLECVELWLDDWNVFTLSKKSAPSTPVTIPSDIETRTKEGSMRVSGVDQQNAQLDASWMNVVGWIPGANTQPESDPRQGGGQSLRSFFSRFTGNPSNSAAAKKAAKEEAMAQQAIAEDITGMSKATVFIRINTVSIRCQVSSTFATELERATKKPPPKQTKIAVLTSSFDEASASLSTLTGNASAKASQIIGSVLPAKSGRIFIGFPTAQTTGLLAHISAPSLIPTVERENIDLNARYVRTWNTEILSVAGIACRIAYMAEMNSLRSKLSSLLTSAKRSQPQDSDIESLLPAAIHALKQFTFSESTPLSKVGSIVEESFWTCNKRATIEIFSSRGVLSSHDVRIASENLSFVNGIPVLPTEVMKQNREFITKIQDFGLLSEIKTSDIKKELEKQALSEKQLIEFLQWSATKTKSNQLDSPTIQSLFEGTIANVTGDGEGKGRPNILVLGQIKNFVNTSRIPPDMPVPDNTIPFNLTKTLNHGDLQSFGWEQLQIVPWVRWILQKSESRDAEAQYNPMVTKEFTEKFLGVVSKSWDSLSPSSKSSVTDVLVQRTVIPTRFGMKKPPDAYFATVKLFDDLPTIEGLNHVKEKFLKEIGVRKTIELSVIFERLMTTSSAKPGSGAGWSHHDLIRYLVSVWGDIPAKDIEQLKGTALCPAEKEGDPKTPTSRRYKMSELFEPKESLRSLGLPIIQWPSNYNAYNSDGKFLLMLGLRKYPSVPELVDILSKAHASGDTTRYEAALNFFTSNYHDNKYAAFDLSGVQIAFLPVEGQSSLYKPDDCFTDSKSSVLGYRILRQDLQSHAPKLGVRSSPPMNDCVARLIQQPPLNHKQAKSLFQYFGGRLGDLSQAILERLHSAPIIPITQSDKDYQVRFVSPNACFLGDGAEYGEIFDYVDFGQQANAFLLSIGCKHEPTTSELTRRLLKEPARILNTLEVDKYMALLRKLHANKAILQRDKSLWKEMKKVRFLLAASERPISQTQGKSNSWNQEVELDEEDDSLPVKSEWHLKGASEIVIVDDLPSYSLFKDVLFAAPQEEALEDLYWALGTPQVSALVEDEPRFGPRARDQTEAENLRKLIIERAHLFLHEQASGIPRQDLKHDVKWLDKNLEVQLVQSVSLRRTLRGLDISHLLKRSASITRSNQNRNGYVLCFASKPDFWHVSQAIVYLLLERPRMSFVSVFETLLTTSLQRLRARGYNVDRILVKKAAEEKKIADLERQRVRDEERKRLEDAKAQAGMPPPYESATANDRSSGHMAPPTPAQRPPPMPGAFDNSPPPAEASSRNTKTPKSLFSSISKSLGFDNNSSNDTPSPQPTSMGQDLRSMLGQNNPWMNGASGSSTLKQNTSKPPGEGVTDPSRVTNNLKSAIGASRAYGSNTLFSQPQTSEVKESPSYCDHKPGQSLKLVGQTSAGIPVYLSTGDPSQSQTEDPTAFYAANSQGLEMFAGLLLTAGSVFGLARKTLHIYYDTSGPTIAFNSSGSLFCNFRYFAQLHLASIMATQGATNIDPQGGRMQALIYWWVVLCHELAHNLVADHSAAHSFYTEQFVAEFFGKLIGMAASVSGGAPAA